MWHGIMALIRVHAAAGDHFSVSAAVKREIVVQAAARVFASEAAVLGAALMGAVEL